MTINNKTTGNVIQQALEWINDKYDIRINAGSNKAEFKKKENDDFQTMFDEDFNEFRIKMAYDGIMIAKDNLLTIIFSRQFPSYDPYHQFLNELPQYKMEKDYIQELADIVQCDDQEWWTICFKKWLVAVVAALDDYKVNQFCPILCSPVQGIGKSSFWQIVIPPELKKYVFEGKPNPNDKDSLVNLSSCAFINLDEAEALSKRNIESTKRMITQEDIRVRRAYAREISQYNRRASFMGSSNEMQLLHDSSNRRFGCFQVNSIDLHKDIDIHKVYAQAYHLYKNGFQYWFNEEEIKRINEHNKMFRVIPFEEEIIKNYLLPANPTDPCAIKISASELRPILQKISKNFDISKEALGKTLARLGFTQTRTNGLRKWIVKFKDTSVTCDS